MTLWEWLLTTVGLLMLALRLSACPAGYESPESLVRHARLIVQVEVLTVEEAPRHPEQRVLSREDGFGRRVGQARVRVVEVLKGECSEREFTLISGPFYTCAPAHYYHPLETGQKLMLILDSPLPAGVKSVAVIWHNRLIDQSVDQVKNLMELARVNWRRAVERHRRVAPNEMALAERLHAEFTRDPAYQGPSKMSFEVMTCLMVLLNDPDHLASAEAEAEKADEKSQGYSNAMFVEFYRKQGVHVSAYASQPVLPPGMRQFFPGPENFDYHPPAEAGAFNRKMLHSMLVDELQVPPVLASSTLADPKVREMFAEPQKSVIWMKLNPGRLYEPPLTKTALFYLIILADPEPDGLVWGTFGLSGRKDAPFLPSDLLVGFLGHHNDRLPSEHGAAHMILTCMPHPQIAPLVRAYASRGVYDSVPGVLVSYFVRLKSEPDVLNAVGIMEKKVEEFIESMSKPKADSTVLEYDLEHHVAETSDALAQLSPAGEFRRAQVRLQELTKRLKAVRLPVSSAAPSR